MDELSHAPQFADKEFDYIVYKNQQIFDEIFVNRRTKTFESRDNYSHKEDNGEEEQDENPTNNALKLRDKMRKEAKKKDDESGWKIHNPNS